LPVTVAVIVAATIAEVVAIPERDADPNTKVRSRPEAAAVVVTSAGVVSARVVTASTVIISAAVVAIAAIVAAAPIRVSTRTTGITAIRRG
jgi:hypothetical protein